MKLVSRRLVIAKVHELSRAQLQMVWPVAILSARIEDYELLVVTRSRCSKSALIAASRNDPRDRIAPGVSCLATLIDDVHDQIRGRTILVQNYLSHCRCPFSL